MNKHWVNYHTHKMFTNSIIADSPAKYEDYINRVLELGQTVITSVEHGFQGNYWLLNEMIRTKNIELQKRRDKGEKDVPKNLHFIFGVEAYWVKDRHEKDNSNCHIILLAKNENGRKKLNLALSKANEDGMFGGRPRLDMELLLELPPNDVFVTTACLAYWNKYEDIKDITLKLKNHFKDNFYLEVQNHNTESQKELNEMILQLSKQYNIDIIAGMDSHYITEEQGKVMRDKILEYKGIRYEDEEGWYLDYPSYDIAVERFKMQGVLSEEEIYRAMNNTCIIETFDDLDLGLKTIKEGNNYKLDSDIKLPTLYPDKTQQEKDDIFKAVLNKEWKNFREKEHIPKEEYPKYLEGIKYEAGEVIKTGMTDYFLLHYKGLKLGKEKGGHITKRGRGCFTKDALIVTQEGLKTLDNVKVGDKVISDDGMFHNVIDTYKYDIQEDMLEFQYQCQGSSYKKYKNICTLDHKILVNRNNKIEYIRAKDLKIGDLLCSPKIKIQEENKNNIIDLVNYNYDNYDYDDNYIYEKYPVSKEYIYSPRWLERNNIVNSNFAKEVGKGYRPKNKKGEINKNKLLNNTPFKTLDDYQRYENKHGFTIHKTPRYIKNDYLWNVFIGLMYGDGWTFSRGIGLAINNDTKYIYNRYVFKKISKILGIDIYYNFAKNRNLIQMCINSKIIRNYFEKEHFKSEKGKDKFFNANLLKQNKRNLKGLYNGLLRTDGSININTNKMNFDNTSLSLINAFKYLNSVLGYEPMALDVRLSHIDKRGYTNKESYKLRKPIKRKANFISSDDNYWFLPITSIERLNNIKTSVYDLHIQDNHSYMINNIIVHNSGVGYFINTLLGFSKVDRFKAPIKLYPERFLTADRILKSKSLPDIDNNIDNAEPFIEAFRELLGEHSIYPMVAFGTLQKSSAIKLYMGAEGVNATIQNEVSKQLKAYDLDVKHCETDEEKEEIDITKYISKEYLHYINDSKPYQGTIVSKSPHPCGCLILNGDIREEVGLIRCESKSKGTSVLTACIEGKMADHYKYLKTDLLIVDVVGLTEAIWKRIGKESITNTRLEELVASDEGKKAWDIYANGYTLCVNQCEGESTRNKCKKYKMKTTAELSAFVAGIRPAFASLLNNFLNRKPYTTGVEQLDEVLKDSYHYMLYQESIMAFLNWLGIDMKETYDIVKKISKKVYMKHPEQMEELKNKCRPQWIKNVGNDDKFEEIWKVMNDAGSYAFNSAHSYCVGNDGLELAYLKAYYPYEFYETCLNWFDRKKNKDKVSALKEEMKRAFGIGIGGLKYGLDNRQFTLDKENKVINPSLNSLKDIGNTTAQELYIISQDKSIKTFYDLLKLLFPVTEEDKKRKEVFIENSVLNEIKINKKMIDILIKIDYFSNFGKSQKLLDFFEYYKILEGKKSPKKKTMSEKINNPFIISIIEKHSILTEATFTKFQSDSCLKEIWNNIKNENIDFKQDLLNKKEIYGYLDYKNDKLNKRYVLIQDVNDKYTPKVDTYCLNNGTTCKCKISKKIFKNKILKENDVIYIHSMQKKFGYKKVGEDENGKPKFETDETKIEWWITDYSIINDFNEVLEDVG